MTTTSNDQHTDERYYVPNGSHWPVVGSLGLLFLMVGLSTWLNGADAGFYIMLVGLATIIFMITGWFGTVIGESVGGLYNDQVVNMPFYRQHLKMCPENLVNPELTAFMIEKKQVTKKEPSPPPSEETNIGLPQPNLRGFRRN